MQYMPTCNLPSKPISAISLTTHHIRGGRGTFSVVEKGKADQSG